MAFLFLAMGEPLPRHIGVIVIGSDFPTLRVPSDQGDVADLGRERFDKIIAIAVNPATYEEEAITALRKARELVKEDRALAHPAPPPPPAPEPREPHYYFQVEITNIPSDWLTLVAHRLSKEAYALGLKSKIEYDFSDIPAALNVRADGCWGACSA